VTPNVALEAFDMIKLLFFLFQLELFFVGATICKMSHLMALKTHEMRYLHFFLLLHLSIIFILAPFFAFDFALVGTNATHVTEVFFFIMLSRVTFDFVHLSIFLLKYFT